MMRAFTLLEMLITVGIMSVLVTIIFALPNYTRQEYDLINAAHRVAGDIQRAQGLALATASFKGNAAEGGWGIYIEPTATQPCYVIFQDVDRSRSYSNSPVGADLCDQTKTGIEISERIYLPSNVRFDPATYTGGTGSLTLVLVPPHPDIFLNGVNWLSDVSSLTPTLPQSIQIVLTLLSGEKKVIIVNALGVVEVQ